MKAVILLSFMSVQVNTGPLVLMALVGIDAILPAWIRNVIDGVSIGIVPPSSGLIKFSSFMHD